MQPDEGQDETPTLENPPTMDHEVTDSEVDIGSSTIERSDAPGSDAKNHTSPIVIDHTSPASPCSTKSTDDNGEQKLSTPGAASSGYGSAVLTQTTSSDDLLGNDDVNGDRSCVKHPNSMVVTAEVNIIDAAVPVDLDSPLTVSYTHLTLPTILRV